jgi:anti-sigma B factor antagonist
MAHTIEMQALTAQIGPAEYVVTATGELDLYSAPRLEEILDRLLDDGAREIVLDLRTLTFLDSTGLKVVMRAAKRLRAQGGGLVLAADSHEVLSVFRVTGLDRFLTIRPTLTQAIDATREQVA